MFPLGIPTTHRLWCVALQHVVFHIGDTTEIKIIRFSLWKLIFWNIWDARTRNVVKFQELKVNSRKYAKILGHTWRKKARRF